MVLAVLSERALPFLLAGLGFTLAWRILDAPTGGQLIGLGIYSGFALATLVIRRG